MRPPAVPASAISSPAGGREWEPALAGTDESTRLAATRVQSSSIPMGWVPRNLPGAALAAKWRSDPIPDPNMRSRTASVPPAHYCGRPQALAGPVQTLHRSYYLPDVSLVAPHRFVAFS